MGVKIILYTERLHLRNFRLDDLEHLFEYRNNKECGKYQEWKDTSKEYLKKLIETNFDRDLNNDEMQFAIALKRTDKLIGDLYISKKEKTISLGFTISPYFQRKGYIFELLTSLIPFLFQKYDDYEICCLVHPENIASKSLVDKLNFVKEEYIEKWNSYVYVKYNYSDK